MSLSTLEQGIWSLPVAARCWESVASVFVASHASFLWAQSLIKPATPTSVRTHTHIAAVAASAFVHVTPELWRARLQLEHTPAAGRRTGGESERLQSLSGESEQLIGVHHATCRDRLLLQLLLLLLLSQLLPLSNAKELASTDCG